MINVDRRGGDDCLSTIGYPSQSKKAIKRWKSFTGMRLLGLHRSPKIEQQEPKLKPVIKMDKKHSKKESSSTRQHHKYINVRVGEEPDSAYFSSNSSAADSLSEPSPDYDVSSEEEVQRKKSVKHNVRFRTQQHHHKQHQSHDHCCCSDHARTSGYPKPGNPYYPCAWGYHMNYPGLVEPRPYFVQNHHPPPMVRNHMGGLCYPESPFSGVWRPVVAPGRPPPLQKMYIQNGKSAPAPPPQQLYCNGPMNFIVPAKHFSVYQYDSDDSCDGKSRKNSKKYKGKDVKENKKDVKPKEDKSSKSRDVLRSESMLRVTNVAHVSNMSLDKTTGPRRHKSKSFGASDFTTISYTTPPDPHNWYPVKRKHVLNSANLSESFESDTDTLVTTKSNNSVKRADKDSPKPIIKTTSNSENKNSSIPSPPPPPPAPPLPSELGGKSPSKSTGKSPSSLGKLPSVPMESSPPNTPLPPLPNKRVKQVSFKGSQTARKVMQEEAVYASPASIPVAISAEELGHIRRSLRKTDNSDILAMYENVEDVNDERTTDAQSHHPEPSPRRTNQPSHLTCLDVSHDIQEGLRSLPAANHSSPRILEGDPLQASRNPANSYENCDAQFNGEESMYSFHVKRDSKTKHGDRKERVVKDFVNETAPRFVIQNSDVNNNDNWKSRSVSSSIYGDSKNYRNSNIPLQRPLSNYENVEADGSTPVKCERTSKIPDQSDNFLNAVQSQISRLRPTKRNTDRSLDVSKSHDAARSSHDAEGSHVDRSREPDRSRSAERSHDPDRSQEPDRSFTNVDENAKPYDKFYFSSRPRFLSQKSPDNASLRDAIYSRDDTYSHNNSSESGSTFNMLSVSADDSGIYNEPLKESDIEAIDRRLSSQTERQKILSVLKKRNNLSTTSEDRIPHGQITSRGQITSQVQITSQEQTPSQWQIVSHPTSLVSTPTPSRPPSEAFTPSPSRPPSQLSTPSPSHPHSQASTPSLHRPPSEASTPSLHRPPSEASTPSPSRRPSFTGNIIRNIASKFRNKGDSLSRSQSIKSTSTTTITRTQSVSSMRDLSCGEITLSGLPSYHRQVKSITYEPSPGNTVHIAVDNLSARSGSSIKNHIHRIPISRTPQATTMADDELDVTKVPGVSPIPKNCPPWKRSIIEKKNQEIIDQYKVVWEQEREVRKAEAEKQRQEEVRRKQEEEKWAKLPEWKRKILQEKSRKESIDASAGASKQPAAAPAAKQPPPTAAKQPPPTAAKQPPATAPKKALETALKQGPPPANKPQADSPKREPPPPAKKTDKTKIGVAVLPPGPIVLPKRGVARDPSPPPKSSRDSLPVSVAVVDDSQSFSTEPAPILVSKSAPAQLKISPAAKANIPVKRSIKVIKKGA